MSTAYDYVVVGAGSAGCVLAYRLSADPGNRVLLIEAGGKDSHPLIKMPKGLGKILFNPRYLWPFTTEPEAVTNELRESWARGKTLGGSSAVNGMMYVRGEAANYDRLAEIAGDDWSWSAMAEAYRAIERHELGAGPARGDTGPLRLSMPDYRTPLTAAVLAAGEAMGLELLEDVNDPRDGERVGYAPRTIWRGRRVSAATAFLGPARRRRNLTVVTGVTVDRVLVEGGRAIAVVGERRGRPVEYRAGHEIVVCAGALASPAILQRSGIGPVEVLQPLGIPVVQDSPGVGGNLREHRGIVMQWKLANIHSQNREFRGLRLIGHALRYWLRRTGAMTGAAYDMGAWFKTTPDQPIPDAQLLMAPYTFNYSAVPLTVEPWGGLNFCVYKLRPDSVGTVRIRSKSPTELPVIAPNYLSANSDRAIVPTLVRYARRYVAQAPLAPFALEETRPGAQFESDDQIYEAYRQFGYGNYHACGTCRMGTDAASVVDGALRVRGVDGLRVADTAVFPFMLAGNTQAPAMAVAWRAADLILRAHA